MGTFGIECHSSETTELRRMYINATWRGRGLAQRMLGTAEETARALGSQNTSFRELFDELRASLAVKYLRDTDMKSEDIALALGFSDAANFRHAFRRWTNESPSEFKQFSTGYKAHR